MNQTEYNSLRATLVQGCTEERRTLIGMLTPTQRQEFTRALVFAPSDALQAATWQMLAIELAFDSRDQQREMKNAASGKLAALEAPEAISATVTNANLQGAL